MPMTLLSVAEWKNYVKTHTIKTIATLPETKNITNALETVYAADTIYTRFDALSELIAAFDAYLSVTQDEWKVKEYLRIAKIFTSAIVDAEKSETLKNKMLDRKIFKANDLCYLPWHFFSIKKDKNIQEEKKSLFTHSTFNNSHGEVTPFPFPDTDHRKEKYRVLLSNNYFMQLKMHDNNLILSEFDTTNHDAKGKKNSALYVISTNGEIFFGSSSDHQFYSCLMGTLIQGSGTMTVKKGKLISLENKAGDPCHFSLGVKYISKESHDAIQERTWKFVFTLNKMKYSEEEFLAFFSYPNIYPSKNTLMMNTARDFLTKMAAIQDIDALRDLITEYQNWNSEFTIKMKDNESFLIDLRDFSACLASVSSILDTEERELSHTIPTLRRKL